MSTSDRSEHYPTAESTLELLTEGQRLKQKLREQYAEEIEAALLAKDASLDYYYASPTASKKVPYNASLGPSSSESPERGDLLRASNKALADAAARERQLKALIGANEPIRSSLRLAQEHAMKSLIEATESSLAWEMRLAAEEADPFSPLHENFQAPEPEDSKLAAVENTNFNSTDSGQRAEGSQKRTALVGGSTGPALHTSPFRDGGSVKEKEMLEKRLGLLLKLQTEHKYTGQLEAALLRSGVIDPRNTYVEEAVDVVAKRDMEQQQLAKRTVASAVSDSRFEAVDVSRE